MLNDSTIKVLGALPFPLVVANSEQEVVVANRHAEEFFSNPHSEGNLIGLQLDEIVNRAANCKQHMLIQEQITHDDGSQFSLLIAKSADPIESDRSLIEGRLEAILETTVDGIITINERGDIETFNKAATEIFGYQPSEAIGRNISLLMPDPFKSEHDDYLQNYLDSGQKKIIGIGRQVTGKRKDNTLFPMDLSVSEVQFDGERRFTGIVRDISERLKLEKEILRISDEERARIGQDLHDELGQMLTGIGLLTRNIERKLRDDGSDEADQIAEITQLISQADEVARTLSHGLMPVVLDRNGLSSALQRLTKKISQVAAVRCLFEENGSAVVSNDVAVHLYRIAQEAINNSLKHGKANEIRLKLQSSTDQLRLRVSDDGQGFDEDWKSMGGMGVRIMQHRASIIGGRIDISSSSEFGTSVTCTIRTFPEVN